jgi:hypothetical protein
MKAIREIAARHRKQQKRQTECRQNQRYVAIPVTLGDQSIHQKKHQEFEHVVAKGTLKLHHKK